MKNEDHPLLELPDINEESAGYLIGLWQEAGLMSSNGMGPVPLSWVDIRAWEESCEVDIPVWEKLVIRELSEAYVSELLLTKEKMRPAPYMVEDDSLDRSAVANNIYSILSKRIKSSQPTEGKE